MIRWICTEVYNILLQLQKYVIVENKISQVLLKF